MKLSFLLTLLFFVLSACKSEPRQIVKLDDALTKMSDQEYRTDLYGLDYVLLNPNKDCSENTYNSGSQKNFKYNVKVQKITKENNLSKYELNISETLKIESTDSTIEANYKINFSDTDINLQKKIISIQNSKSMNIFFQNNSENDFSICMIIGNPKNMMFNDFKNCVIINKFTKKVAADKISYILNQQLYKKTYEENPIDTNSSLFTKYRDFKCLDL